MRDCAEGASHLLDDFALLPLLHILVEERAGERRLDQAHPSPCPSPRVAAGRGEVIGRDLRNVQKMRCAPVLTACARTFVLILCDGHSWLWPPAVVAELALQALLLLLEVPQTPHDI